MKIMLSAGEASGDLHGAKLAEAIKLACPEAKLFGMGGTQMKEAGVEILQGIDELGVIGSWWCSSGKSSEAPARSSLRCTYSRARYDSNYDQSGRNSHCNGSR